MKKVLSFTLVLLVLSLSLKVVSAKKIFFKEEKYVVVDKNAGDSSNWNIPIFTFYDVDNNVYRKEDMKLDNDNIYVFDNDIYTIGVESLAEESELSEEKEVNYVLKRYTSDLHSVNEIKIQSSEDLSEFSLYEVGNDLVFIDLSEYNSFISDNKTSNAEDSQREEKLDEELEEKINKYFVIDKELANVEEKQYTDNILNINENIKKLISENQLDLSYDWYYDISDNEVIFIKDNKLYYYVDDQMIFAKENNAIFKASIWGDYIVTAEDYVKSASGKVNYSRLVIYDKKGNEIKKIDRNNNIYDYSINKALNKLTISYVGYDGVCALSYTGVCGCVPSIEYAVYDYKVEEKENTDEAELPFEDKEETPVINPNTTDIIVGLITFIAINIIVFANLYRSKKKLED